MDGPQLASSAESQLCCRPSRGGTAPVDWLRGIFPCFVHLPSSWPYETRSFGFSASIYIAPSLRNEVTLPGRVCLSPRSQRRLFLHLPGVWSRAFAMRSPLRVESFSGLDRNEDSSRTFPSVLVPRLRVGVTLIGSSCFFLCTRSERRLVQSTYPRLLRDGVTLWVESGFFFPLDRDEVFFG